MMNLSACEANVVRRCAMGDVLVRSAARHPNKRALLFRERDYTYQEFNDSANRCANGLMKLGLKKGDKACIMSHNSDFFLIFWWALLKIGAIITPINWVFKGNEITYIVNHSEARIFFVEDLLTSAVTVLEDDLKGVEHFGSINLSGGQTPEGWMNVEELLSEENSAAEPQILIEEHDPATLLYTSGTEAAPKGVLLSHLNFIAGLTNAPVDLLFEKDEVWLAGIPFFHMAGLWMHMATISMNGLTIAMYLPERKEILELTQKERVGRWCWPVTIYVSLPQEPGFEEYDLSSLRFCQIWGSAVSPALIKQWEDLVPGIVFSNGYGQSEATQGSINYGDDMKDRPDSVGKAFFTAELKIFGEDGRELPPGEVGEIVVRSPGVMLGYFKEEEKTAYSRRGGWHHTGDLGRMDEEGYLYFEDRIKDMIKTGGENVASAEVESVLYGHPNILEVAVIGLPHEVWGEAVTAVVVVHPGESMEEQEVISWCKERIAGFKVPKKVIFMDELPKNTVGKILKKDLRQKYTDVRP